MNFKKMAVLIALGLAVDTFFAVCVGVAALSFPGATILTLAGGAIFGLGWGLAPSAGRLAAASFH